MKTKTKSKRKSNIIPFPRETAATRGAVDELNEAYREWYEASEKFAELRNDLAEFALQVFFEENYGASKIPTSYTLDGTAGEVQVQFRNKFRMEPDSEALRAVLGKKIVAEYFEQCVSVSMIMSADAYELIEPHLDKIRLIAGDEGSISERRGIAPLPQWYRDRHKVVTPETNFKLETSLNHMETAICPKPENLKRKKKGARK